MRGIVLLLAALLAQGPAAGKAPAKILFDTDMDSDCDDAGALGMLHALADRGEAEILATVASSRHPWSPACVDAINTYYGRPDWPIGRPANGPDGPSKYARGVARRFPHDVKTADAVPDAVRVYRRALAAQPDGGVVLLTVGDLTNVAALLRAPAADGEPSGRDLARRKVAVWVCLGGNFIGRPAADDLTLGNNNFTSDKEASLFAVRNWPGKLVFVGREIGSVPSGLKAGARLRELPEGNPVRAAYALWFGGEPRDRHVADQTAVLYAVRGPGAYWREERGAMDLRPDMTFRWRPDPGGRQAYLVKQRGDGGAADREVERVIEALMMQPPRKAANELPDR
jgi:hypothetical protein